MLASLRSTSTKNGLKRISRMFFETINNFSSYSSKQRPMFIVLQHISSSPEKANSEFSRVTDCTYGLIHYGGWRQDATSSGTGKKKEPIRYRSTGTFIKGNEIPEAGLNRGFLSVAAFSTS